jgi:hypothetical protein
MASTGINNGTLLGVYIGGTLIAHSTSATLDVSMSTRDETTKDSAGWSEKGEGLREWSISGDFLVAEDATYGYGDLMTAYIGRTLLTVKYSSEVTGDVSYTGSAYLTSLSRSAGTEDSESGSYTLEGTGILSPVTVTT